MAKRFTKQKAGQQKKRRRKRSSSMLESSQGASGTLGGLRRFTQGFFSGSGRKAKRKSPAGKILDVALWAAVAVAAYFLVAKQCMR